MASLVSYFRTIKKNKNEASKNKKVKTELLKSARCKAECTAAVIRVFPLTVLFLDRDSGHVVQMTS